MKRPYSFDDIKGHTNLVNYFKNNIEKGTLKHFLILEGPEGLGKTSLADIIALHLVYGSPNSDEYRRAYDDVVVHNSSDDYIKRFKCSVDGGKEVAKLIKDEMNATFTLKRPKVIICDECHGLTEQAQDVFLSETEFISDKVYVIMLTTEANRLKASLRSRAVPIHLEPLKRQEMLSLLKNEVVERKLNIQNEDVVLQMIADWAENKPRTGLNILGAFGDGDTVPLEVMRELIGYLDAKEIVPLVASLSGSMTYGLSYIDSMTLNGSIVNIIIEMLAIKSGQPSYKLKLGDVQYIREQLEDVTIDQLTTFLFELTSQPKLTKATLIHAFIHAHSNFKTFTVDNTRENLATEQIQIASHQMEIEHEAVSKAPSFQDILQQSKILER